jgi:fructose-1,6-bisphosphatase/inositol monophosphatase family enzyme
MPRFRQLAAHEIDEKSGPHDLVTDADRQGRGVLSPSALVKLLPGSVVVGEEAVHANPATYEAIKGEAPVWIVDPVDGTRQFVHGDPGFCTLVALAHRASPAGVLDVRTGVARRLAVAVKGQGRPPRTANPSVAGSPAPGRRISKWPCRTRTTRRTTRSARFSACWTEGDQRAARVRLGRA